MIITIMTKITKPNTTHLPKFTLTFVVTLMVTACFQPSNQDKTATQQHTNPAVSHTTSNDAPITQAKSLANACNNAVIYQSFSQKNPNKKTQVLGCGDIIKILPDDNDGTRHQKMLVKIDGYPQITVLIAHNIDLAKRIDSPKPHTPIQFYGEYIYNDKGGVVHWTHKDPSARHQDGWLAYQGQRYW